jgi:DNA processing protein
MQKNIELLLEIGFADFLTLEKRRSLMYEEISLFEFRRKFRCDYSREVYESLKWLEKQGDRKLWVYGSPGYPDFRPLEKYLPFFLFVEGRIPDTEIKAGVVGTRRCDLEGLQESFRTGFTLGLNGIGTVTGNAEGCDQGAVNGALTALENGWKAPLVSVLGCGLNVNYPYGAERMRNRITDAGGSVISRFAPDMPPLKQNFPNRNQIIAALGSFCIVVQSPIKSGSEITADLACQMGRDIYVTEAGLGVTRSRTGTQRLYDEGCPVFEQAVSLQYKVRKAKTGYRYGDSYYQIID